MSGTKEGARKANQTKLQKYGSDHFKRLASAGGKASKRGGFGASGPGKDGLTGPERAKKIRQQQLKLKLDKGEE